jgi:hypothetical protein
LGVSLNTNGTELAAMRDIPIKVSMPHDVNPLTGLPDEPADPENLFRDIPHFCG